MDIHLFALAAIEPPQASIIEQLKQEDLPLYEFNKKDLFTAYSISTGEHLFRDDHDQWYAAGHFVKHSLHDVKYSRQTFCPPYKEIPAEELSFYELLNRNGFIPDNAHYDKAMCHVVVENENIEDVSWELQSRLAHVDGDDDPQVAHTLHYIETILDNKKSRFISGWESHSFATITESRTFCDTILLPISSWLYLLYFAYFLRHDGDIPSDQMMPRLLGNLWASTSKNFPYNEKLIQIQTLL